METVTGINASANYTGTIYEMASEYEPTYGTDDAYTIASISVQAVFSGINSNVLLGVSQSNNGVNFDPIRDEDGDALTVTLNGTGNRVIGFDSIHARYFRIYTTAGSATAGTINLFYTNTATQTKVIKRS